MTKLARQLRKRSTPAEKVFWSNVRNRRFMEQKFNRQYVIRYNLDSAHALSYIVDFYCHVQRLVVEIDGGIHNSQVESDLLRERHLKELGYQIIRFRNEEVLFNWSSVRDKLEDKLKST